MARLLGIDLGTTNSVAATLQGTTPMVIPNRNGRRLTPSVVGLDSSGQVHVGDSAFNQLQIAPERTVAEVKRKMGSGEMVTLGDRTYRPQEISAFILKSLKEDAERHFGEAVTEAVVTVPAYFTDAQRQATRDAGELAGLTVERIINEPTAAALAYGLEHLDQEAHVLVYDLGGGTFDVSVLEMFNGVLDVKASSGNNSLGGADFDARLVDWLLRQLQTQHGVDVSGDLKARARLRACAERAKIDLSSSQVVTCVLPFIAMKSGAPVSAEFELSRAVFEAEVGELIRSTLEPIKSALSDARLEPRAISEVVLVGGSSRIPLVHRLLTEFFGKPPRAGVNPDEAVALGAAVQAGLKAGSLSASTGIMITDVAPFTLGVEVMSRAGGGSMVGGLFSPIIQRNSTVPISRTEVYRTTSDQQRVVDIRVFQGEDQLVKNNVLLGSYAVEGVPPAPGGAESVAVTFTYDLNGILNVKTRIVSTGKEAVLVVDKSPRRLSPLEREEAKGRVEREWSAPPSAPRPPVAPAAAPAPARDLLIIARQALSRVEAAQRSRVEAQMALVEAARLTLDAAAISRAEAKLTELLFELDS